ncbi:uncharacterized protein [Primulina huaijiensis]|uniref:uncharacterized protein n=1 Tax=Primulina huaijiensis TaxID=1492673 RepID=UPI003CC79AA3
MEGDLSDSVPCSSIAVNSVIRVSSESLSNFGRLIFTTDTVVKQWYPFIFVCFVKLFRSIGHDSNDVYRLFAAIFSFAHCGIQRYRRRKDRTCDSLLGRGSDVLGREQSACY